LYGKGKILFHKGLYNDALECFDKALKGGKDYQASLAKGFTLLALERYDQALKEFKSATRIHKESADLSLGKGIAQMGLRRNAEALKFLDRAISMRPNLARAWHEKGKILLKLGHHEEARAAFAESIRFGQKEDESGPYWP
jgi:tetratricopeptide (TPR) repeat protein